MQKAIPIHSGIVENGQLTLNDQIKYREYIKQLGDCEVEIIIRKRKKKRSLPQNAFYWVYLSIIATETGHTEEELHELFKKEFIPSERLTMFGKQLDTYKTTTELSVAEFSEYLRNIEKLTGILCPDQEEIAKNFSIN